MAKIEREGANGRQRKGKAEEARSGMDEPRETEGAEKRSRKLMGDAK